MKINVGDSVIISPFGLVYYDCHETNPALEIGCVENFLSLVLVAWAKFENCYHEGTLMKVELYED